MKTDKREGAYPLWCQLPDQITAMRVERGRLYVDTAVKRYRIYERFGRGPRVRLVGLLKDLSHAT